MHTISRVYPWSKRWNIRMAWCKQREAGSNQGHERPITLIAAIIPLLSCCGYSLNL